MNENLAVTSETYSATELFVAGSAFPVVTDAGTIASGANLARGAVLGKITIGAASVAAAGAGEAGANTGNGTLVMNATTPILKAAKSGVYQLNIVKAAVASPAAAAVAHLFDPDGDLIGVIDVATNPGTVFAKQLKFTIKDGATAFVAGDGFSITVAAGAGTYKLVDSTSVDGSDVPSAILASSSNATDGAVVAPIYLTGEFNAAALAFGGSDTYATHKDELRKLGIFVKTVA